LFKKIKQLTLNYLQAWENIQQDFSNDLQIHSNPDDYNPILPYQLFANIDFNPTLMKKAIVEIHLAGYKNQQQSYYTQPYIEYKFFDPINNFQNAINVFANSKPWTQEQIQTPLDQNPIVLYHQCLSKKALKNLKQEIIREWPLKLRDKL